MSIESRLKKLGLEIPLPPRPIAAYVPGVVVGNLVFTSGQLPTCRGELIYKGKLGLDLGLEEGMACARQSVLNCLGVVKFLVGSLDRVERIVKMTGYIQSADNFYEQPRVLNGASELLEEIFGEAGQHARAAVGVSSLPLDAPCEIELIVQVRA